ncbi:MAG: hypothetical protein Q9162_002594 [Coniocarpon cinnabarinum]
MAPPSIDFSDDLDDLRTQSAATAPTNGATKADTSRTLLLAPPSLASHPAILSTFLSDNYPDRTHTDVQMLDRLSMGLVALPAATFDLILLLSDANGSTKESIAALDRRVLTKLLEALKPGGLLRSQDNTYAADDKSAEHTEAILSGLVADPRGMHKPLQSQTAVPLKLGRKTAKDNIAQKLDSTQQNGTPSTAAPNTADPSLDPATLEVASAPPPSLPPGVGIDMGDVDIDLDATVADDSDGDLVDEDSLLTEEDKKRPVNIPAECQPVGRKKRRRACKDCTCGLAQRIEAEDAAKRAKADKALAALDGDGEGKTSDANGGPNASGPSTINAGGGLKTAKLGEDDLAEVDFTVPGKVGSCGNCALGDAFRCDGCPYIGLPAFKPGEEVRVGNEVQL